MESPQQCTPLSTRPPNKVANPHWEAIYQESSAEEGREPLSPPPSFLPSFRSPVATPATHCAFTTRRLLLPPRGPITYDVHNIFWFLDPLSPCHSHTHATYPYSRLLFEYPLSGRHMWTVPLSPTRLRFTSNDDKSREGGKQQFRIYWGSRRALLKYYARLSDHALRPRGQVHAT